ncbi:hypothetical protein HW115_09395 [Verrucomicrobiaceae bacterium N1E253]|uniref:Roadblock/LAMTOR2 domain-containing protein n=1 Tax=Oceaniferula marina TaxID=2748318 RepID=A0A851GNW1_9BACT|nr:hypothetical protein [Oceaniferula marina]NWK55824.1 hypothetical protein [Oceaniferula marina]
MGQVRDTAQKLYESNSLLGFAITSLEGEMVHNESFFSDEAAGQVIATMVGCVEQLAASGRTVKRLSVEMDDVIVIYTHITDRDRHGMFILSRSCPLDAAADAIAELAA